MSFFVSRDLMILHCEYPNVQRLLKFFFFFFCMYQASVFRIENRMIFLHSTRT